MARLSVSLLALLLAVYLGVAAPPMLPEHDAGSGPMIPIDEAFDLLAHENATVRALYAEEIVGAGKKVGLRFDEHWRRPGVDAGPLPALFLRETAMSLERSPQRLGLFLGSDFPIRSANAFGGVQQALFLQLRGDRAPRRLYDEGTGLHTAMYADVAVAEACVTCHNRHPESPKHDWRLGDVMGATTWTYPRDAVSLGELLALISALRQGVEDAYGAYLAKLASFERPPCVGVQWPRDGLFVPDLETFMAEVARRNAGPTLDSVLSLNDSGPPRTGAGAP